MTERQPADAYGVIFDTNSKGRYNLVVLAEGIAALRGNYRGSAVLGASAAAGGAFAAVTSQAWSRREGAYLRTLPTTDLAALLEQDARNFLISDAEISRVSLRRRWFEHAVLIESPSGEQRRFAWKPKLNDFRRVQHLLSDRFGQRLLIG